MNEPRTLVFLLPIWGDAYIEQFFARGLLTLLAPGNLPKLAAKHPLVMRFLTHNENFHSFRGHKLFPELEKYCKVEYIDIADIIFPGNYSTSITMAYLRGMEASGENYCEDWFFYLVADYIFADGAWGNLLPLLADDKLRGITNGNFQVIEDEAWPLLEEMLTPQSTHLAIAPRALMKLGLAHTHPIVMASTLNQELCHNRHANRLFWRVDHDTLVGRFFLRHMLAIRPERRVTEVGASCDYSFIPEFCPSGEVFHITDSDMFALIELQPQKHELSLVEFGPWSQPALIHKLNEWTTKDHRENASTAMIFHAADIPPATASMTEESAAHINYLRNKLQRQPQPSRGHHYWVGAINAARSYLATRDATSDAHLFNLDEEVANDHKFMRMLRNLHFTLFGRMSKIYPWHPRWLECRYGLRKLLPHLNDPSQHILMVTRATQPFADWLRRDYGDRVRIIHTDHLKKEGAGLTNAPAKPYDLLFIHIDLETIPHLQKMVTRAKPYLSLDARVLIFIENEFYTIRNDSILQYEFLKESIGFFRYHFELLEKAEFGGYLHRLVRLAQQSVYARIDPTRLQFSTLYSIFLAPLYTLFFVLNMLYLMLPPRGPRPLSSIFILFRNRL